MHVLFRAALLQSFLILSPLAYAQTAPTQALVINWNLLGNNSPAAIDPVVTFGNAATPVAGVSDQITSVWKWNAANTNWMFFAPSLSPTDLTGYATTKSYGVLSSIPSGDGYWVNAKAPLTLTLPSGTAPTTAPLQALVSGWNLVGNNTTAAIDPVALFGDKYNAALRHQLPDRHGMEVGRGQREVDVLRAFDDIDRARSLRRIEKLRRADHDTSG